jgi:ketosteroid isomerase-like protein
MKQSTALAVGACLAVGIRVVLRHALLAKFRHDVCELNAGRPDGLLAAYDEDAVLRFHDGQHRWAGTHRGKQAIGRFLQNMVEAGLQGTIREIWMGGPPWALTLVARFDDQATGPDGSVLYSNRAVLVVRTRWGRIVEQDDFYEDTARIEALEDKLRELDVPTPQHPQ